ncbi:MAG: carbamoyl-phosphate synthase large subunit, partial [Deltaproteobacteria bacterium]|nr:carbamoyl-phosphate synthase large subunit [Deltaproteobacteria bacterium]
DPERLAQLYDALSLGLSETEACALTGFDPWFVSQLTLILQTEKYISGPFSETLLSGENPSAAVWRKVKAQGFSDVHIAKIVSKTHSQSKLTGANLTDLRLKAGVMPHFRQVDTCAGEFSASTPYYYSSYDSPTSPPAPVRTASPRKKVMILGGGPNRIGQGIEFDYCCVKASQAFESMGLETIMVNSNPETVSTDYDAVGRLYFEPVTLEDVLSVFHQEKPDGVIVQLGGQTPLNLAQALKDRGVPIWGTDPQSIFTAEDRNGWNELVNKLKLTQPPSGMAQDSQSALSVADRIGYPIIVRPSFVLGGRAMRIIHHQADLLAYVAAFSATDLNLGKENPILVDKFLDDAVEVDVDAVADGERVVIAAIMEHIERAGVHSGDSCCSIPPFTLPKSIQDEIRAQTEKLGLALGVKGLMNIQFAVCNGVVYVLEANPRASRTAPFVAKATGRPLIQAAAKVMAGQNLMEAGFDAERPIDYYAVKEAVLPWTRFRGAEVDLGPEMHSTGEVMGLDSQFGLAFLKAQSAAGMTIPDSGNVVLTVCDRDKPLLVPLAADLIAMGYAIHATPGTHQVLKDAGLASELLVKLRHKRPNLLDFLRDGQIQLLVNTISGSTSAKDATVIRAEAINRGVTLITTMAGLTVAVEGLKEMKKSNWRISPLQDYH